MLLGEEADRTIVVGNPTAGHELGHVAFEFGRSDVAEVLPLAGEQQSAAAPTELADLAQGRRPEFGNGCGFVDAINQFFELAGHCAP